MKQRVFVTFVLLLGIAIGGALPRWFATSAPAQMMSPPASAMPMSTQPSAMPAARCAKPMEHGGMMGAMMGKTPADRAYMGAMMEMHGAMMRHPMTGNADQDFLRMMIPHHESAVQMSKTELQYGTDPKVKALAKAIIVAQNREIREMNGWLKK